MDDLSHQTSNVRMAEEKPVAVADSRDGLSGDCFTSPQNSRIPSKPTLIDAEGLQKTLQGLTNMALAHEIALNKDFKLKKPAKCEEPLSQEVQLALEAKEKYWEKVDQILMEKNIEDAKSTVLDLIHTLRTMLHGTTLPHNVKLREKIDQELDTHKVSREIDNEAFDFVHYMTFILDTLSMLCCPIRDKDIVEIRSIDVPSKQVRRTIDLMENMNLDMANFIISQSRQHIVQNCVTYERNKFASYAELQYKMGHDPVAITREWVTRHISEGRSYSEVMAHAFLEILEWDESDWPETLTLDWGRFPAIREEIRRVTVIGAMVAAVFDYARGLMVDPQDDPNDFEKNKQQMMKNLQLLMQLREELNLLITCEEVADQKKFEEALERCCIQAVLLVDQHHQIEKGCGITLLNRDDILALIRPLNDLNHPVRLLYYRRVKDWFNEVAKADGRGRAVAPPNLNIVGPLIIVPISELLRIAMYNRGVYDVLYREIHEGNCPPPQIYPLGQSATSVDKTIVNLLMKLTGVTDESVILNKFVISLPAEEEVRDEKVGMDQRRYDQYLLANEPTLKEDYETVHVFNVGNPDWMKGYTTEQLLKIMERENIINANKLRRIKERLEKEVLQQHVTDNLPAFEKVWREVGASQVELSLLERILQKQPSPGDSQDSSISPSSVLPKQDSSTGSGQVDTPDRAQFSAVELDPRNLSEN